MTRGHDNNKTLITLDSYQHYKVVVYTPEPHLQLLLKELNSITTNTIGNYKNCFNWYPVNSCWTTLENANPYNGEIGKQTIEEEYKIEFLCNKEDIENIVSIIRKIHPYEEPVIDIIPLFILR